MGQGRSGAGREMGHRDSGFPGGWGSILGLRKMRGDFRPPGPQMLLVTFLAVPQEQPSVVQCSWAIMGQMGPRWAFTGTPGLLGPLLSLRLGAGQTRPWVSLE